MSCLSSHNRSIKKAGEFGLGNTVTVYILYTVPAVFGAAPLFLKKNLRAVIITERLLLQSGHYFFGLGRTEISIITICMLHTHVHHTSEIQFKLP